MGGSLALIVTANAGQTAPINAGVQQAALTILYHLRTFLDQAFHALALLALGLWLRIWKIRPHNFTGAGVCASVHKARPAADLTGHDGLFRAHYYDTVFGLKTMPSSQRRTITVTGATIAVKAGNNIIIPSSIIFSNGNQDVTIVPQAPLPDASVITVAISGVQDLAGNKVAAQSTQFTTGTGPDVVAPRIVSTNPFNGATNVPLNTALSVQTNEPIDASTVNSSTFSVSDSTVGGQLTGTYSVSNNGQTVSFVPATPLAAGDNFSASICSITDLAGNSLANCTGISFTAGFVTDTLGPQVIGVSPPNALTGVPTNAQVVIAFNEPIDALTTGQVTLGRNGVPVPVTQSFTNGNQMLILTPVVPLSPSTGYTVSITGVKDVAGQVMSAPQTTAFTTRTGADLIPPTIVSTSPVGGAVGVPTNAVMQLQFSERVDALTVNSGTFFLADNNTGLAVAGTIVVAADGMSATLTPSAALLSSTSYTVQGCGITDLVGQQLCLAIGFTTQ